jgi:hypothetical protein
VSGASNAFYDPVNGAGDTAGSTGAYTLIISGGTGIAADRFEPNDTLATATDFGTLGRRVENDLTVDVPGDFDVYRFTAAASGPMTIDLAFLHAQGDLAMLLLNEADERLALSNGRGDGEQITYTVTEGETYFLEVQGYTGAMSPHYDLIIDAPSGQAEPPRVTQVFVNGEAWTDAFRTYLASEGLGDAEHGFAVPGGVDQLEALPWMNVNEISIRFDQPVTVDRDDLTVSGVNVATYPNHDFSYDPDTFTATWTVNRPLADYSALNRQAEDRVRLDLDGDGPEGVRMAGRDRLLLDGDWADGTDAYPSGNGRAGGDFRFLLNVVPGDINRNGNTTAQDYSLERNAFGRSTGDEGVAPRDYTAFKDVNGSGAITVQDLGVIRGNLGASIESIPAAAAALRAASAVEDMFGEKPIL